MKINKISISLIEGTFMLKISQRIRGRWHQIGDYRRRTLKRWRINIDLKLGAMARKKLSKNTEIVPNRILFMAFQNAYACNPKYITDEIVKLGLPVEIYWAVSKGVYAKKSDTFPENVHLVVRESLEFYQALASSKIWVDNAINCVWKEIPKKPGQIYLNTWHGSMGLKKITTDAKKEKYWVSRARVAGKLVDYCISDSKFENMVYKDTYWQNTPILEYGHARNDLLFDENQKKILKRKVCTYYKFFENEDTTDVNILDEELDNIKICLYAPTFRDSKTLDCYDIDFDRLISALTRRYGGKWKVLNRFHFKNRATGAKQKKKNVNVVNATNYPDMQELMVAADVGITDYSSWICDFVLTGKPGFIYARDIEEYNTERGLYYKLETTPFPIATNNDEMMENVLSFDEKKYSEDVISFLEDKGCVEDGHASEKIVKKVSELMGMSDEYNNLISEKTKSDKIIKRYFKDMSEQKLLAHALGGVDQIPYTNSDEALEDSYRNGIKFFETDVRLTKDKKLVLVHGFTKETCRTLLGISTDKLVSPHLKYKEFMNQKVAAKYTVMSFRNLYDFMENHKDMYVMIDIGKKSYEDTKEIYSQILVDCDYNENVLQHLIVGGQSMEMIKAVKDVYDFKLINMYCGAEENRDEQLRDLDNFIEFCKNENVLSISIKDTNYTKDIADKFHKNNLKVYVFTVNESDDIDKYKDADILGTDFLHLIKNTNK